VFKHIIAFLLFFNFIIYSNDSVIVACERCHSHNDYLGDNPLFNAINKEYKSIEVDVVLHDNLLYVAHHKWLKKKNKFIENMYLDNLYQIYIDKDGWIYEENNDLILLVDIKTSANDTYKVIEKILNNYKPMLSYVENDSFFQGAVTVILSGNKPDKDYLTNTQKRYVFIDGRISDLGNNISNNLMPLISINWKDQFIWKGRGKITKEELTYLNELVYKTHLEKKKIRFWASPDNELSWETLYNSNVDLINTDRIIKLYEFIKENKSWRKTN
tara:strand:+ start:123 stop:938 length:816 start_codon:yes stop_codon:yes gene_type:complete